MQFICQWINVSVIPWLAIPSRMLRFSANRPFVPGTRSSAPLLLIGRVALCSQLYLIVVGVLERRVKTQVGLAGTLTNEGSVLYSARRSSASHIPSEQRYQIGFATNSLAIETIQFRLLFPIPVQYHAIRFRSPLLGHISQFTGLGFCFFCSFPYVLDDTSPRHYYAESVCKF